MSLGQTIIERLDEATIQNKSALNRDSNHASETGWANVCMRRLCLLRECPEKQGEPDLKLLQKFEECHRQEKLIVEELSKARGIKVLDAGSDKQVLYLPKFEIICELDARVSVDEAPPVIMEIKSCDPGFFQYVKRNKTAADLLKSNSFFLNLYPPQLWTQMLARKEADGMWLFKNRADGQKHYIETNINEGMSYMGQLLARIEQVNALVKQGKAPDASPCDGCSRCLFYNHCFEDGPGPTIGHRQVEVIQSEDLETKACRWRELKVKITPILSEVKELEKIEDDLKGMFRGRDVSIGGVSIRVKNKYQKQSYEIPPEVKKQYEKYIDIYRMVIEDLETGL